jgi:serine/threonine-protein kinase HipA
MTPYLEDLKAVERAWVFKKDAHAGVLTRRPDGIAFSYLPTYIDSGGQAVASSLPVSHGDVAAPAGAVPPFFSGLLPEGRRLSALRAAVKTSPDDELSLLLAVGGDTVGDVRIVPEQTQPEDVQPRVTVTDWSDVSFAELFASETGLDVDRTGIPGVQEKVSAVMMTMPVAKKSLRYILKLEPPEYPNLVANEAFMLSAAGRSGLPVVEAEVVRDREDRRALLVQRFDRTGDGRSLGVEDGCQVLNRYPAAKYAVTTEEVCRALAEITDAPVVTARALLRWVVFAYLACNGDLHAKNLAVGERPDGSWQATPAYDLPSSYPYRDYTMALSINGKHREDIARRDVLSLAAALAVPERAARKVIDDLLERLDLWLPEVPELPFAQGLRTKWHRAIQYRARQLSDRA